MRTGRRNIASGNEYDYLFPKAKGENVRLIRFAELKDTIRLMKKTITSYLEDTRELSKILAAPTEHETCANVWNFCFKHLQYRKDDQGKEQVRRPARSWQDRHAGVDCDCITVFIGSILTNLKIPFLIRLTKYNSSEFEHVYPVAITPKGEIIMDCVVHQFNYQVPYSNKKDVTMELQFLNGFDDEDDEFDRYDPYSQILDNDYPDDAQAFLLLDEDLEGLEGKAERQQKKAARQEKREDRKEARQEKREEKKAAKPPGKEGVKKVLNVVNKVNPATALLRAGILASMKLNLLNAAAKLRFAYWSEAQAKANNVDPAKYKKLLEVRKKIESIFYGAGGKLENLKEAILKGKGNADKRVALNGLGAVIERVHDDQDLRTIIGEETFYDEFASVENVNGLGEPITVAAAVTAAAGVIGTIVALIKKIGSLFVKGSPQAQQEIVQDNTAVQEDATRTFSAQNLTNLATRAEQSTSLPAVTSRAMTPAAPSASDELTELTDLDLDEPEEATTGQMMTRSEPLKNGGTGSGGIVQWIKDHPIASLGIAAVVIGGTVLAVRAMKAKKSSQAKKPLNGIEGLNGLDGTRRRKPASKKNATRRKSKTTVNRRRRKRTAAKTRKAPTPAKRKGRYPRVELL